MSKISAKMSEICYQIRLVYICARKLLDEALLASNFFSTKTLAVAQHHWYPHYSLSHRNHKTYYCMQGVRNCKHYTSSV